MTGDLAALACALCFAICSLAFASAGRKVGSVTVNQTRIVIAVVVLALIHLARTGACWPAGWTGEETGVLLVSGVIGLALGDQCYFFALTVIGPRRGTLLMSTFPLFALVGDGVLRGYWPPLSVAWWILLCLVGVLLVLSEKRGVATAATPPPSPRLFATAVVAGFLGALGQGTGLVLTRMAEDARPEVALDAVSMTLVRMVAGLAGILVLTQGSKLLRWRRKDRIEGGRRMSSRVFGLILIGVVFGPTLGVWLSMVAVQQSSGTGRPAVLIALTPVMMIPIAWIASSERPGLAGWSGTLLAFAATAVLMQQVA